MKKTDSVVSASYSRSGNVNDTPSGFGQTSEEWALFKFQHAAICYGEAFARYIEKQINAVAIGYSFSAQDCMILHSIRLSSRPQSIPDIQHFLNRGDVANVQYGVKKLIKAGLIERAPRDVGRGTTYRLTHQGATVAQTYIENRRRHMSAVLSREGDFCGDVDIACRLFTMLTGVFDHLSRIDDIRP